jgi:hypothetical protein
MKWVFLLLGILTLGASVSLAQIITGSIVGQVTDPSGAVIPAVQVTVTNQGTGISVQRSADASGAYSIPDLQAGVYDVTVTKTGFRTYHGTGVQLLASQTVRVDVKLEVGNVQQQVTVTAQAPLVNTEGAEIRGTASIHQIMDLPLAQQSIDGLMILVPGAQNMGSSPQIGGATHWGGSNFTINGIQANDFGNGAAAYSYGTGLISLPALDSLQEFKIDAYSMNAEYRNVDTVTMVTKAGGNQFHGELYEYNENADLNANTFLNNAAGKARPPAVRNQFAGNVGGPILKNKLFFFADYTGFRNRQYSAVQLNLPTMQMRQGDFSALLTPPSPQQPVQLYNPATGAAFGGNQVTSTLITSQAKTLMTYLPTPTSSFTGAGLPNAAYDYYGLVSTAQDMNEVDVRVDYHISDKDSLYGVYTRNIANPYSWALGGPSTYGNASSFGYKTFGYSLVETHTFNPHALNDLRLAWFNHPNIRSGINLDFNPQSLFPQLTTSPNRGLPTMNLTAGGYPTMFNDYGKGYYGQAPDGELTDNFTYIHGHHTIKAGTDIAGYKTYGPSPNASLGSFSFSGQWTGAKNWPGQPQSQGNAFADFLLGTVNSTSTSTAGVFESVYSSWDTELYGQDAWQATPHLTITYGLRYTYQTPWKWQDGYSTYWDPNTNKLALPENASTPTLPGFGASATLFSAYPFTTTQALGLPLNYMVPDKHNWSPRFGFAYRPFSDNRTVVRGGYGIYYQFNPSYAGSRDDVLNPPWVGGLGGYASATYNTLLSGSSPVGYQPDITFANPFPAALQKVAGAAPNPTLYSMQRDFENPMEQQWDLTLEHEFTSNWSTRISYVGAKTTHVQWFFADYNIPKVQIPNETTQQQRPFQPWATIDSTRSGAIQYMNQLQLEATRRFANGFSFQAEYQWTRSLDNVEASGGLQNPNFARQDYGNSTSLRRHVLVFNYIYELPFGKGKHFLANPGRVGNALIGGWQVTGITTYETGTPYSLSFSVPSSKIGWWGGRPDQVGSNLYAGKSNSHNVIAGVPWFNASAFAAPQPWAWGDAPRNNMFGPGTVNWDISALKRFQVMEHMKLELRGDFLNAFNHFTPSNPSTTVGDTRDGGTAVTTTGNIYSGSGSRIIQVGARILF